MIRRLLPLFALLLGLIVVGPAFAQTQPSALDRFLVDTLQSAGESIQDVSVMALENFGASAGSTLLEKGYERSLKWAATATTARNEIAGNLIDLTKGVLRANAARIGKIVNFIPYIEPILTEGQEVLTAFKTEGWVEAIINVVGGVANALVADSLGGLAISAGSACFAALSAMPPVAVAGFALCWAATTYLASAAGDGAEYVVEAGLRRALRRSGGSSQTGPPGAQGGGRTRINANVDDVTTSARDDSTAMADIGTSRTGGVTINVDADDVTTTARDDSVAYSGIGIADGRGSEVDASVEDVTTIARGNSSAESLVGVAGSGGRVTADVREDVLTSATGGGHSTTVIGRSNGGNVTASVRGSVATMSKGGAASTRIGDGASAMVRGDVVNRNGDLSIGGSCVARRDGACCIQIHRNYCVLQVVPPNDKGACPPRFERSGALCYLYSDKQHSLNN